MIELRLKGSKTRLRVIVFEEEVKTRSVWRAGSS
jgi:hypothetical protein